MGEISEALRRARSQQERECPEPTPARRAPSLEPESETAAAGGRVAISEDHEEGWVARAVRVEQRGHAAEHYRHFAIRVSRELRRLDARSVLLTSAARAEGKTTTACNLALALASMSGGRRIVLLELDLRRPSIADYLDVAPPVGIEEVLEGSAKLRDALVHTNLPALDLCLARRTAEHPLELLSGPSLAGALRELSRRYDLVVVDTPPVLPVPDVPLILPYVDAGIVVARAGSTRHGGLGTLVEMLGTEKLIGAFVNEAPMGRRARYYGYYGYYGQGGEDDAPERSAS